MGHESSEGLEAVAPRLEFRADAYSSTTHTLVTARSTIPPECAGMAKLVDASDLKSAAARRAGSIPAARTTLTLQSLPLPQSNALRAA